MPSAVPEYLILRPQHILRFAPRSAVTFAALTVVTLLPGCMNPASVRMPQAWTGHPRAEQRAYQDQDPFPEPDIGPETSARPRGFVQPRTEPRRAAEQRMMHGISSGPESVPPGDPRGGLSRPRAVN